MCYVNSTTFLLEIPRAQQPTTGSGKVRRLVVLLNHRRRV
ncbi:LexA family transcriptional regulator [Escherichia coli]|nr:LexA family transcriptional regulator [Escherichia coli]PSZ14701.1 LexA family transcriptional regulator [Escherichia sp. 4726-5]PTN26738.1 LexA family transcriptional regulator [Escherichia sp. MOD1-EC6475]